MGYITAEPLVVLKEFIVYTNIRYATSTKARSKPLVGEPFYSVYSKVLSTLHTIAYILTLLVESQPSHKMSYTGLLTLYVLLYSCQWSEWSSVCDSNTRPADYGGNCESWTHISLTCASCIKTKLPKSAALPTELTELMVAKCMNRTRFSGVWTHLEHQSYHLRYM